MCEVACAAGFFNGDGHCGTTSRWGNDWCMRLQATQAHSPEVLHQLQQVLGGRVLGPYTMKRGSLRWTWVITRPGGAWEAIKFMWPWLSSAKRQQAVEARIREATLNLNR